MNEVTKPKHPGRVAAGKKTAELNRKRKEDLLRNHKRVPPQVDPGTESVPGGDSSWKYGGAFAVTAAVALGIAVFFLFPTKKSNTPEVKKQPENDIFCMN